jgi:hypothetical protein
MIVPLEHAPTEGLPMAWARALRIKESGNTVAHQPKRRPAKANGRSPTTIVKRPGRSRQKSHRQGKTAFWAW